MAKHGIYLGSRAGSGVLRMHDVHVISWSFRALSGSAFPAAALLTPSVLDRPINRHAGRTLVATGCPGVWVRQRLEQSPCEHSRQATESIINTFCQLASLPDARPQERAGHDIKDGGQKDEGQTFPT